MFSALQLIDVEWGNIVTGQQWAREGKVSNEVSARLTSNYASAGVYVLEMRLHPIDYIQ